MSHNEGLTWSTESEGAIEIDPWDSGLIAGEESRLGGQFSKNKISPRLGSSEVPEKQPEEVRCYRVMLRLGSRFGANSKSMVFKARGENTIPRKGV